MAKLLDRISIDPAVCGGKPCIRGTRIWVSLVLDLLAGGMSEEELRAEYPQLSHEDVLAAIAYGAEAARDCIVTAPISVLPVSTATGGMRPGMEHLTFSQLEELDDIGTLSD